MSFDDQVSEKLFCTSTKSFQQSITKCAFSACHNDNYFILVLFLEMVPLLHQEWTSCIAYPTVVFLKYSLIFSLILALCCLSVCVVNMSVVKPFYKWIVCWQSLTCPIPAHLMTWKLGSCKMRTLSHLKDLFSMMWTQCWVLIYFLTFSVPGERCTFHIYLGNARTNIWNLTPITFDACSWQVCFSLLTSPNALKYRMWKGSNQTKIIWAIFTLPLFLQQHLKNQKIQNDALN